MRKSRAKDGSLLQRSSFAGIPRGKADELVDETEWHDQNCGIAPAKLSWNGHQIDEDSREWRPGREIDSVAFYGF
jgi:hypothetical protein